MHLSIVLLLVCCSVALTFADKYDKKIFGFRYMWMRTPRTVRWGTRTFRWGKMSVTKERYRCSFGLCPKRSIDMVRTADDDPFNMLDEDHNGFITLSELQDDLHTILKGETRTPEQLMTDADENGDGQISENEFEDEMKKGGEADYLSRRSYGAPHKRRYYG